ncbi:MAG: hypothetical protein ACI4FZ_04705 [Lachnospiraceae bacterium]
MIDSYVFETLQRENIELGKVIRELRQEAKITQKELYDGLCSKEVYTRIECGCGKRR